jgi:hypothetical protein
MFLGRKAVAGVHLHLRPCKRFWITKPPTSDDRFPHLPMMRLFIQSPNLPVEGKTQSLSSGLRALGDERGFTSQHVSSLTFSNFMQIFSRLIFTSSLPIEQSRAYAELHIDLATS